VNGYGRLTQEIDAILAEIVKLKGFIAGDYDISRVGLELPPET
jgi:hypothetical protein